MEILFIRKKDLPRYQPLLFLPETEEERSRMVVLGAEEAGEPIGTLVVLLEETLVELYSIYVREEHRGQGVGTALLAKVREKLKKSVIRTIEADFSMEYADVGFFLDRNGFFIQPDASDYSIRYRDLKVLARTAPEIPGLKAAFYSQMRPERQKIFERMVNNLAGMDLFDRSFSLEKRLSGLTYDEMGKPWDLLICTSEIEDKRWVLRIMALTGLGERTDRLLFLLRYFLEQVPAYYPEDTEIRFSGLPEGLEDRILSEVDEEKITEWDVYFHAVGEA